MRILHVWNTAGVASIIAKFMDRLFSTESLVVHRKKFDKFGFTVYGELWDCGSYRFILKIIWLARKFDIIHIHDLDILLPILRRIYPKKPLIIHYHGSKIRNKWSQRKKYWKRADIIFFSTKDLCETDTPEQAIYLPNPVDIDLFHPISGVKKKQNTALAFLYYLDEKKAKEYADKYGLALEFLERNIPYRKLPEVLNRYSHYIDRTEIPSLSKTGLEALACGLKVIRWDGKMIEKLPEEHYPDVVVRKLFSIYQSLLQG